MAAAMLRMGLTEEQATAIETAMKGMVEAWQLDRGEIEGLTRELANLRGGGRGAAGGFDLLDKGPRQAASLQRPRVEVGAVVLQVPRVRPLRGAETTSS